MPARVVRRTRTAAPTTPVEDDDPVEVPEEDGEEVVRPTRARPSARTTPKPSAPAADADDDDEEDDEDEDRPNRAAGHKGWAGAKKARAASGDFPEELKLDKEPVLIKFMEEEPFASYRQHWIERPGKKSWTCLEDNCPLCALGDRPSAKICFNVLSFENPDVPENKIWIVGTRVSTQLENYASDKKTGPLTKHYYSLIKSGKGTKSTTAINPIKERDLAEDWDIEPLTPEELATAEAACYDDSVVQFHSKKQLREIADEINNDDDEED